MEKTKLQWHPAFGAALRITLQDEMRYLEMQEEIYYLKGDPIPMQILIAPKLSDKENYWLQSMRTNLRAGAEIRKLMSEYEKHRKSKDYAAVMDLITLANWEQMEVEKKMCDALKELFAEELKEADSRGRSEGMRQGLSQGLQQGLTQGIQLTKRVLQLSAQGDSMEMIAGKCNVSLEQVKKILE